MDGPLGPYFDDDAAAIKLNMKFDPVDIELYTAKFGEGSHQPTPTTRTCYVARVGVNITKDMRATLKFMLVNEQALAGQSIGDTFWIGATFGAKLGTVQLDAGGGIRSAGLRAAPVPSRRANDAVPSRRAGTVVTCRRRSRWVPSTSPGLGWYTSGDSQVGPAGCGITAPVWWPAVECGLRGSGHGPRPEQGFRQAPDPGVGRRLVRRRRRRTSRSGSWVTSRSAARRSARSIMRTRPAPTVSVRSVTYALTPAFSLGGGVAYVGASDADGPYGSWAVRDRRGGHVPLQPEPDVQAVRGCDRA